MDDFQNFKKYETLNKLRDKKAISREEHWEIIKKFLIELQSFSNVQKDRRISMNISKGEIVVKLPISASHNCHVLMYLDSTDVRSVPFSVLADGFYEPTQSDILIELGKLSRYFLDIGSNMGFYSLALASENHELKIKSFEPQPSIFNRLKANIELNQMMERVEAFNIALGTEDGSLTMYIPAFTGSGGGSFQNLHPDEGEARTIRVNVKRLDDIEIGEVDLMKMDVEGFEYHVLEGALSLIEKSKPTVMVGLLRKWMKPFGTSPQGFLKKMVEHGYSCFAISESGLIEIDFINEETIETNFIFSHSVHPAHLNLCKTMVKVSKH
jgi:FkbM family methyltransferase